MPVERVVWVGLVDVVPLPGNSMLGDSRGAFVNVLALSKDQAEFERSVRSALAEAGLHVASVEDVRAFDVVRESGHAKNDLVALATHLTAQNPVICDEFQPYM